MNGVAANLTERQADGFCQPVYESTSENPIGQRLVLTSWMLLDELKRCQEELDNLLEYMQTTGVGEERLYGCSYNPLMARLENAHFNVSHILRLLWRSGLWAEEDAVERVDTNGRTFHVLEQPFTDGKLNGRVLPEETPLWQRALLGLTASDPEVSEAVSPNPSLVTTSQLMERL